MTPPAPSPDAILDGVRRCLADVLALDLAGITGALSLVEDLGAESLDFLDLLFRLEQEFGITISRKELDLFARLELDPEDRESEVLSERVAAMIRAAVPGIDGARVVPGMSRVELARLITVDVVAALVAAKLGEAAAAGAGP